MAGALVLLVPPAPLLVGAARCTPMDAAAVVQARGSGGRSGASVKHTNDCLCLVTTDLLIVYGLRKSCMALEPCMCNACWLGACMQASATRQYRQWHQTAHLCMGCAASMLQGVLVQRVLPAGAALGWTHVRWRVCLVPGSSAAMQTAIRMQQVDCKTARKIYHELKSLARLYYAQMAQPLSGDQRLRLRNLDWTGKGAWCGTAPNTAQERHSCSIITL